ncbi:cytochrome C assembly protein [Rhodothermaceae bacterium RA]|nr:cytochrome C assembly protein [Rhodothermaceae bacterium RA]
MIGTIGWFLILVAFVASGLSAIAYFQAAQQDAPEWRTAGRTTWMVMTGLLLGAAGLLFYLFLTHQFQYAYVWSNSSRDLPLRYLFSSFWSGQEGSFLLWIVYICLVGLALMRWAGRSYEAPVMTVVAVCQLFLLSMIVGLQIGPLEIGSSPFKLLAERFPDAPIFQQDPNFVPADGSGLNDLLQNPWMVIHPPTLFIGFATMIVPFAFAIAALWKRRYTEWVRPALPWTLLAVMILGIGIAMGGYWAYVTLSFGGYWAWDPVENSSLVPWLVGVAALHTMIVQKRSGSSHKAALLLSILAFLLVVYSTFLTRSGILGDVSVHSFVDLGLNNQLLVWILTMALIGFGLFVARYRELPTPKREPDLFSREFVIFSGAMLLCALAAAVILGTSAPILGRLFRDNPSTVPIEFYNKWTLPLAIGFTFLMGIGQLLWWHRMNAETVSRVLLRPVALAVVGTIAVLLFTPFVEETVLFPAAPAAVQTTAEAGLLGGLQDFWAMYGQSLMLTLLLFVAFFAFFGNGIVLWKIGRGNLRLAGGAVTHLGFAITVFGLISSGAFSMPLGREGRIQTQSAEQRDNFVLTRGETRTVNGYRVTYTGREVNAEGRPVYVLEFTDPRGRSFTLRPVVYKSNKDQWIQHPDLKIFFEKDLYAAVTPSVMYEDADPEAAAARNGELELARGEATTIGNQEYVFHFVDFDRNVDPQFLSDSVQVAVASVLEVTHLATDETRTLRPIWMVMQDGSQQYIQNRITDWGLTVTFTGIDIETGRISLFLEGVEVMPEDWVVVQAYEKPFISLLWFGIILLSGGFCLAIYRRWQDARFTRGAAVSGP